MSPDVPAYRICVPYAVVSYDKLCPCPSIIKLRLTAPALLPEPLKRFDGFATMSFASKIVVTDWSKIAAQNSDSLVTIATPDSTADCANAFDRSCVVELILELLLDLLVSLVTDSEDVDAKDSDEITSADIGEALNTISPIKAIFMNLEFSIVLLLV